MPRRERLAVDHKICLQPLVLLIAVHIRQTRQCTHLLQQARRPFVQLGQVIPCKRVLVHCATTSAADAKILHWLQDGGSAGHTGQFLAQAANYLLSAEGTFLETVSMQ